MTEEKKKHAGGRPSDYTPEIIAKAREYIEIYDAIGHAVPLVAGLARHCNISRETVYSWAKCPEKQEFSDIISDVLAEQEIQIVSKGLSKDFDSPLSRLMLSKHGYQERQAVDYTSSDGTMSPAKKDLTLDEIKAEADRLGIDVKLLSSD